MVELEPKYLKSINLSDEDKTKLDEIKNEIIKLQKLTLATAP